MKYILLSIFVVFSANVFADDKIDIRGTYVLESRQLTDGTILKNPDVIGLYTVTTEYMNFNIVHRDKSGKIKSISLIAKNKITENDYYEEVLYFEENDEISGSGVNYKFTGKGVNSQVVRTEGKVESKFPTTRDLYAVFTRDGLIATRQGVYTDYWVKVK